jgi:hypothetical protein
MTVRPFRLDEPMDFIEAESGMCDPGSARDIADAEEFFLHLVTP